MKKLHKALLASSVIALMVTGCNSDGSTTGVKPTSTPLVNGNTNDNGSTTGGTTGGTTTAPTLPTPAPITLPKGTVQEVMFPLDYEFTSMKVTLKGKTYDLKDTIDFNQLGIQKGLTSLGQAKFDASWKEDDGRIESAKFTSDYYSYLGDHVLMTMYAGPDQESIIDINKANYSNVDELATLNGVTYDYKGKAFFATPTELKQGDFNYQINFKGHNATGQGSVKGLSDFGNITLTEGRLGGANQDMNRALMYGIANADSGDVGQYDLFIFGNGAEVGGRIDFDEDEIGLVGTKQ